MKPVFQTVFDKSKGNCFSAALASIMEIPLEDVPYFRLMKSEEWVLNLINFLRSYEYMLYGSKYGTDVLFYSKGIKGYYIVNGRSSFYALEDPPIYHSVVFYKGKMVHDPNPNSKGLLSITSCYMIERIRETQKED